MEEKNYEMISFGIIAHAGDARSHAFLALDAAKSGDFEKANELMMKSDESNRLAHQAQTELLFDEMNGISAPMNMLLVHAQDHLMTAMLANELIKQMIELYRRQGN